MNKGLILGLLMISTTTYASTHVVSGDYPENGIITVNCKISVDSDGGDLDLKETFEECNIEKSIVERINNKKYKFGRLLRLYHTQESSRFRRGVFELVEE